VPRFRLIVVAVLLVAAGFSFARVAHNPPGYYIDEASISYNAHTISQTARDEFGTPWPLYLRAFGDYKNPIYIYLLAGIYRLAGPGIMVARLFSATLGLLAASVLGFLAGRITQNRTVGLIMVAVVAFTPWHFEMSRIVLEVALYPLALALLLLLVHRAASRPRWSSTDILFLTLALDVVTYTYSIGRLLGPLLALGLFFFATRPRRRAVAFTAVFYVVTLLPILRFSQAHPGALSERFQIITYLDRATPVWELAFEFGRHFLGNLNPWKLLVTGDPNPEQIAHVAGTPLLSFGVAILAAFGLVVVFRRHRSDPWWRFVIYGLVISIVPASLTNESVHMLRLAPLMVFLFVITIPALETLQVKGGKRPLILAASSALIVVQGLSFQLKFHASAHDRKRLRQFDHGYPAGIFARALALPERPIYLADAPWIPGYIQAYWNAVLRQVPISDFVRLGGDEAAPEGAMVISTEENCPRCAVIRTSEFYTLYRAVGLPIAHESLPKDGFQATITPLTVPAVLGRQQPATFEVTVRNDSSKAWPARERGGGRYQVSLGNHWLDETGRIIVNDDGRAALFKELRPGESVTLRLMVNTPRKPGTYILEFDMLQEGVSWFGLQGSSTTRVPVRVE
jgi:4-amino-4-deoxy-L-arabinose transferase-like glycosyltransferase